jgi:hypothetical protein
MPPVYLTGGAGTQFDKKFAFINEKYDDKVKKQWLQTPMKRRL